jgi:hypothetical protein
MRRRLYDALWLTFRKLKSFGAKKISEVKFPVEVQVILDGRAMSGCGLWWTEAVWRSCIPRIADYTAKLKRSLEPVPKYELFPPVHSCT